ncbi:MFS general substrate transporter [Phlegmacium glaucopus]|nr:MFS general substrate transporter [Phlegmacium glaucopus]
MEDLRHPSYRRSSESSFIPIDPFKPSVAYGLKNIMTPRRANTMDDTPQVERQPTVLLPSIPPDGFIPSLTHNEHIRLPPPHELTSRADSTPLDPPHHAIARPLPQRSHSGFTQWGITDRRTSSPIPFRTSPTPMVERASFGISDSPLNVIREDETDADIWEEEYRGSDIRPQYSTSENPRPHGRHNTSRTGSPSTQARENTSRMATEAPRYATSQPEKETQHPPYGLSKAEEEPTIESDGPLSLSEKEETDLSTYLFAFMIDTLPRQIYLHLLLRLPYLYFSRVARIFQDAEMSMPEIKKMALEVSKSKDPATFHHFDAMIMCSSPPYINLQRSWGLFIDSLLREWKTLNIISVLLLSAILSILQIPSAADDLMTRYTALLSMICALMSLLYGCVFIIRFGTMRTTYKAAEWAREAQESKTSIFWNVWVLLAMPTTWLAWSIVMFCVCIMSFVWRTGTADDANRAPLTAHDVRIPRIIITVVFALGIIYFVLIASTLRRYGEAMDRAWQSRIMSWMQEKVHQVEDTLRHHSRSQSPRSHDQTGGVRNHRVVSSRPSKDSKDSIELSSTFEILIEPPSRPVSPSPSSSSSSSSASSRQQYSLIKEPDLPPKPVQPKSAPISSLPKISHTISTDQTSSTTPTNCVAGEDRHTKEQNFQVAPQINVTKLFSVSPDSTSTKLPLAEEVLASCLLGKEDYEKLALDVHSESHWDDHDTTKTLNVDRIKDVLQRWNNTFFLERGSQIQLCEELVKRDVPDIDPDINKYNIGTDTGGRHTVQPRRRHAIFHFLWKDELPRDPDHYKSNSWPEGLREIDILYHHSGGSPAPGAVDSDDGLTQVKIESHTLKFQIFNSRSPTVTRGFKIYYVRNGSATPSKESSHYATSRLSEPGGISSDSDPLTHRAESGSRLRLANETQGQDAIERSEFKLPNLSSLFIIIGGNALSQLSFFIVISSASIYAEHLGGSATFSGLTIGIPVIFSGIALIFTTRLDGGRYRQPLAISYAAMILGNVLYALAYRANFLYLILIGRIITGFGFISFMYTKRYCSDPRIVGIRQRTTLASWLVIGQVFGFSVGPFIGGLLYKIGFANKVFNGMTSPGWVMSVVWILFWILSTQIFNDVPIRPQGESYELSLQTNGSQPPAVERQQVTPQQWGVIICMCYYAMTCFFILGSWESNIPVFTAQALGYSPFRAGNFIALGGIAAFPFLILNVRYARRIQDRVVLASGTTLGLIGLLIMFAILYTDKVHFGSLLACWFLIALGFNLASTCTLSLLSKQLPDAWNGRVSMAIQYSNFVGRVTGAILGGAGVKMGMINYAGVQIAVVGIGGLMYLTLWRQLKTKTG